MSKTAARPYPGSRPFWQADRDRFFGRVTEAAILAEWWRNNRLTFAIGHAGRGKTSLLQAGVLPLLANENLNVLPVGRFSCGASFPFAALSAHNPYTLAMLRSWAPFKSPTRLVGLTVSEFIQRQAGKGVILAAIDPADELLADTGPRRAHRRRFLGNLKKALEDEPRLHLLVVGREETIHVVADALGNGVRYEVTALNWQNAVEAVSRPLEVVGRSFADGAAEKLVRDLQTSRIVSDNGAERYVTDDHVEPALLEVACAWLWDSLPTELDRITVRDVRRCGDVDTALAAHCGKVIAEVADDHDLSAERLSSWLRHTFVTELGSLNKAYEGVTATAGMPNVVPRALEDRHLLSSRLQSGSRWYELLSDRLIGPLQKAAEVRPPYVKPNAYLRAAEHALTLGELDLAERHTGEILRTRLESSPRLHAEAYSLLGNLAWEREKPEEAETRYREAAGLFAAISDTHAVAHQLAAIGQTLLAQGKLAEAVDELSSAARRMPNDLVIHIELARALWQLGAGRAAVAVLTTALGIDGGNVAALQTRGEILADLGDARDAMLDLNRVRLKGQPSTRAARGLALAELGDQLAARREIEDAVTESKHNGLVLLYAARTFALGGDDSAAKELAQQAADATDPPLSPQHREVARQLADRGHG